MKQLLTIRFETKDLSPIRQIFGTDIERDHEKEILTPSQYVYIRKILRIFNIDDSNTVSTPVGAHFKLYVVVDDEAETSMEDTPYANAYQKHNVCYDKYKL